MSEWPLDWRVSSLEELASHITSGGTPTSGSPRYYSETGGLPFAKTEDLTRAKSKFLDDCELYVTEAALRESAAKKYPIGTILVSMYGTIGLTKITACELAANQALCALIPPFTCDRDYLYQHLDFIRPDWLRFSGQTTQANINGAAVRAREVPLPPVSEQRAIAQILDTLDTAIRETETLIDKLKAVKQGLLHDLLTRGIDVNGQLRPPQSEAPQLYKESPLGWVPQEWTVAGLAFAVQKDRSVIRTGPFGSSLKGEHWRESGRPVVTIGSLGDGAFIESELLFIDEKTAEHLVDFELCPGDIAFSRVADVGRSVVITEEQRGWIMSSNFMRISVDSEKARPRLLQLLLASSILVRKQIRMTVNSAGRDVANSAVLMALRFPWPMPEEQDQIIERVESSERKIAMEEAQHQKLLAAKKGLMDDLLTGRVRSNLLLETAAPIVHQPAGQPGA
ncbi:restriction endonuclease subunit S [Pseudomonas alvandae]|uniref:restriction endonuclease subunit S n=1 Tax=Pseudomonas TaxID=286 RepID=UPI00389A620B